MRTIFIGLAFASLAFLLVAGAAKPAGAHPSCHQHAGITHCH